MADRILTRNVEQLIAETLAIEAESAQDAGAVGYLARAMVQATLPHKKVEGSEFVRRNGAFTLHLLAPSDPGLPYGSIPRLLLAWLATEAVRTRSRELFLGSSMSAFMAQLDLVREGANITRLKDQTKRLFSSTVSAIYDGPGQTAFLNRTVVDRAVLWWDPLDPEGPPRWRSRVILSEQFYAEVTTHPIAVDLRALLALKKSPMALDAYAWLTYRASYAKKPSTVPWEALAAQFGSDYARLLDFKKAFLAELRKVATVYAGAQFEVTAAGLIVKPGATHIPKR